MYMCKECGWTGEEPFSDRDGDPYDSNTTWSNLCPLCFNLVDEVAPVSGEEKHNGSRR